MHAESIRFRATWLAEQHVVAPGIERDKEHLMLDVVMLSLGLGFFALAVGYAHACEWL